MPDVANQVAAAVLGLVVPGSARPHDLSAQCPDGSAHPARYPAAPTPGANSVGVMLFDNINRFSTEMRQGRAVEIHGAHHYVFVERGAGDAGNGGFSQIESMSGRRYG